MIAMQCVIEFEIKFSMKYSSNRIVESSVRVMFVSLRPQLTALVAVSRYVHRLAIRTNVHRIVSNGLVMHGSQPSSHLNI